MSAFYYANDKDIFDLLSSSKKVITESVLLEIAQNRGIYLSPEESRDDLIRYISCLPNTYHQLQMICEYTGQHQRKEKIKPISLPNPNISLNDINIIFKELKDERSQSEDESYVVKSEDMDTHLSVNIMYNEMDYSKTALKQRCQKEARIEIEKQDGGIIIRTPSSERCNQITGALLAKIEKKTNSTHQKKLVELREIDDPQARTNFFLNMVRSMQGFTFREATKIRVDKLSAENNNDEDFEDEDDDERFADESQIMLSQVRQISLDGTGLLNTPEYQELLERGFFISHLVWKSVENTGSGRLFEFEAGFKQPIEGAEFYYNLKGVINKKSDGSFNKTQRPCTPDDERKFNRILENAAFQSMPVNNNE
jgi:hypothetical protein